MGTDELHIIGDWRSVFLERWGVAEVRVKDTCTAGIRITEHTETEEEGE
ncbi:hypothetical protein ABZ951_21680 [Streptomyces sp. NPDC046215]